METADTVNRLNEARRINALMDSRGPISVLQTYFKYSFDEIDRLSVRFSGLRAPKTGLSHTMKLGKKAPAELPGASIALINVMAVTQTGIACRALLEEFAVRRHAASFYQMLVVAKDDAKAGQKLRREFEGTLARAARVVARERMLLLTLESRHHRQDSDHLDIAAVDYLDAQVHLHRSRTTEVPKQKRRHLEAGFRGMEAVSTRLGHALKLGPKAAEPADLMLAVNAQLNKYFAAYEIDELLPNSKLERANEVAHDISKPLFWRAVHGCAYWLKDPRIAFNAADAAGMAQYHAKAAELLRLSASLDGFSNDSLISWQPLWMIEPLSQSKELARAFELCNASQGEVK